MSQSGTYLCGGGGPALVKITGDAGGSVPTDVFGNLNIIGGTNVSTTGTPATNTLTINISGIITVPNGGTGVATTTPYAVICGGTTNVNPLQSIASVGVANQVLTSNGPGALPTFQAVPGAITSFPTDAGIATPALGSLTIAGGTNIGTTGAGSTVTVNLDANLTAISSITMANAGSIRSGTTVADTALLRAYNNTGSFYTTFATLTSGAVPTMDLADSVTKAGNYIYRAAGTDVAVTDGGTGLSTVPTDGQLLIGSTAGAGYVVANLTAGTGVGVANAAGSITISTSAIVAESFPTDAGTATPAMNALTVAGGTNIGTAGAASTVTVNLDATITAMTGIEMANGGYLGTAKLAGNTALLQAYDVDGAVYTTFATLTANNTPTMDLADTVTKAGNYIYRAGGTDVAVVDGGTGVSTVPTDGQLLIGSTVGSGYVVANLTPGTGVGIANAAGSITISASTAVPTSFVTDAGTATPSSNSLNIYGGTNIGTTAAGATVTANLDATITAMTGIEMATGGYLGTAKLAGNTALLQAYDVDGAVYTTFATLTANNTPTMDLDDAVTKSGGYIYRAGGTDVPIADGGTGASTFTAYAVICGGTAATNPLQPIAGVGSAGDVLTSNGGGALPTFQAPGGGGFTWTEETGATIAMLVDNGYITNRGTLITATLPATAAVGTIMAIAGSGAGGWSIAQRANQMIHFGNVTTTTGVGGSLSSTLRYDCVEIICIVADLEWVVRNSVGNLTVV